MTDSVPLSARAAAPAARRMVSAGHSSRGLPSPTASTLATGSDGTARRVTCSAPPLAPSTFSATSISPVTSASRNGLGTTVVVASGLSASPLITPTINTGAPAACTGSVLATVTTGDW